MSANETSIQFADELLGALGLNSVTTKPVEGACEPVDDLSKTAIVGRAYYSTKNRDLLLAALDDDPGAQTLSDLAARLSALSTTDSSDELASILSAVEQAMAGSDARLGDVVKGDAH